MAAAAGASGVRVTAIVAGGAQAAGGSSSWHQCLHCHGAHWPGFMGNLDSGPSRRQPASVPAAAGPASDASSDAGACSSRWPAAPESESARPQLFAGLRLGAGPSDDGNSASPCGTGSAITPSLPGCQSARSCRLGACRGRAPAQPAQPGSRLKFRAGRAQAAGRRRCRPSMPGRLPSAGSPLALTLGPPGEEDSDPDGLRSSQDLTWGLSIPSCDDRNRSDYRSVDTEWLLCTFGPI